MIEIPSIPQAIKSQAAEVQRCPHCGEKIIIAVGTSAAVMSIEQAEALRDQDEA